MSLLVEKDMVDKIEINFLITGHTHGSIDQYFSVIATAIRRCEFILSPLALMEHVCRHAFTNNEKDLKNPTVIEQIVVVYDMVEALAPIVNKEIKFYSIPHRYLIHKPHNMTKAICQYQVFTYSEDTDKWLPKLPHQDDLQPQDAKYQEGYIVPELYGFIGGRERMEEKYSIPRQVDGNAPDFQKTASRVAALKPKLELLEGAEVKSMAELVHRYENEDASDTNIAALQQEIQDIMRSVSNESTGYIMWVKQHPDNPRYNMYNYQTLSSLILINLIIQLCRQHYPTNNPFGVVCANKGNTTVPRSRGVF